MESEWVKCKTCGYNFEVRELADYLQCPNCHVPKFPLRKVLDDPRLKELLSKRGDDPAINKDKK